MIFMIIESILVLVVVGTVVFLGMKIARSEKADVNKDGKVDIKDAEVIADRVEDTIEAAAKKAAAKVVDVVDVNDDGKVNVKDAKVVAEKVKKKFEESVKETEALKAEAKAKAEATVKETTQPAAKPKRARNKGKFVGDDKATEPVNEAWEGGKAPEKKPKKPKKPKMTVVKK